MAEYARLVVSVDSTQVRKANSDLAVIPGTAAKVERAAMRLGPAIAAAITVQAIRSAQQLAEKFTLLEARVTRLSASTQEAEVTYLRLADIARRTGTDLGSTVQLWESLTGTLRELGASDAQVVRLTETLQKIGAVGGSSAEEMSNSLRQLGQALAGGQLRAEEFNAIVEGMPELAREIARGLGIPFGELRQQMLSGELTAERVLSAIQNRAMSVDAEFAKIPRTVSQASAAMTNDLGRAISSLDQTIGTSKALVWFLETMAKGARLTAGDLTDFEQLNTLVAEREQLEKRFQQAQKRTLLSEKERLAFENGIKKLNEEILEIQDRRVKQQQEESKGFSGPASKRNEEYDKYLAKLEQSAALQGVNSEATKVRYAIESGELGKLLPEQEKALLKYAEEIDAKRGAAAESLELAKAGEQLQQSYASTVQALERQIALQGKTGEVARISYELTKGSLQGVVSEQAVYLKGLAKELDDKRDLTEQEKLRIDILRESGQLRAANDAQFQLEYAEKIAEYERQGNFEALQRLETLRRIREVQMNADQAPGTVEGVSRAPNSGIVSPEIGGAASEFMRLQEQATQLEEWRAMELEKQRAFLEAKAINEEQYAQRVANIQEQSQHQQAELESARQLVMLTSTEDLFGSLAGMAQSFAGEQSGLYKAMFAVEKAAAIARSIVAIQGAIASASWSLPFPANLGAMATVAASTAGIVSTIASTSLSFEGGGFTGSGPRIGGLDGKGGFMAMVHPNETIIDHTKQRNDRPAIGEGMPNIQLINNGDPVSAKAEMDGSTMRIILDRVKTDFASSLAGDGDYHKAITGKYGLQTRGK